MHFAAKTHTRQEHGQRAHARNLLAWQSHAYLGSQGMMESKAVSH